MDAYIIVACGLMAAAFLTVASVDIFRAELAEIGDWIKDAALVLAIALLVASEAALRRFCMLLVVTLLDLKKRQAHRDGLNELQPEFWRHLRS